MTSVPITIISTTLPPFLQSVDTFLLDCDGVLWRGNTVIPGIVESLRLLRSLNKRLIFVSNNSTKTRDQFQKKIENFGIECKKEEIFGSGYATAAYLASINFQKKAYVVGSEAIESELKELGINSKGIGEHAIIPKSLEEVVHLMEVDTEIGAVVVGLDITVTYLKLAYAFHQLNNNKDCLYLASNADSTLPVEGKSMPGAGTMVAMLSKACGRDPIILGKPSNTFMKLIIENCKIDPQRTCMVGDRLDTDIIFGITGSLGATLLVLTGATGPHWLDDPSNSVYPSHLMPSLGDLYSLWEKLPKQ